MIDKKIKLLNKLINLFEKNELDLKNDYRLLKNKIDSLLFLEGEENYCIEKKEIKELIKIQKYFLEIDYSINKTPFRLTEEMLKCSYYIMSEDDRYKDSCDIEGTEIEELLKTINFFLACIKVYDDYEFYQNMIGLFIICQRNNNNIIGIFSSILFKYLWNNFKVIVLDEDREQNIFEDKAEIKNILNIAEKASLEKVFNDVTFILKDFFENNILHKEYFEENKNSIDLNEVLKKEITEKLKTQEINKKHLNFIKEYLESLKEEKWKKY